MKRISIAPRPDWKEKVEALGFDWHTVPSPEDPVGQYWDESAYWHLTADEVDVLEAATAELHTMCLAAAEHAITHRILTHFGFDDTTIDLIEESWTHRDADQPSLYGRFDLAYGGADVGDGQPKMLEYNADTPTGLYEASVVQWTWLEERFPDSDQFNSLHEALVEGWRKLAPFVQEQGALHLTCLMPHAEDEGTLRYMLDTALEAEISAKMIDVADIGWSEIPDAPLGRGDGYFVDLQDTRITTLFKIVPWDWLLADKFGRNLARAVQNRDLAVIEPAWKMVLTNKALLAVLWELYPNHPYLLPAFMDRRAFPAGTTVVAKPLLGREGANISIAKLGQDGAIEGAPLASMPGNYGSEGYVYQALAPLASAKGADGVTHNAVIGSWVIDGNSHGIGLREDTSLITHNRSRFVPHLFE